MDAEDSLISCDACEREYHVPPLPRKTEAATAPAPEPRSSRRSSRQRQARFNLIVTGIATATVVLSVLGMLWLRSENQVHGDTSGKAGNQSPAGESGDTVPWDADNLLADFAPIQSSDLDRFAGRYRLSAELTSDQKQVFGAPQDASIPPAFLQITRQRQATETLALQYSGSDDSVRWSEKLAPTSVRLGQGFHLVASFRPALTVLGAYSVEDFMDYDVHCSVDSHRLVDGKIVVTHACLDASQFERKVPLREREHLCRVVSTYSLDGDTLTITRRASGPDRELTRRFVSMLHAQLIDSRQLVARELTEFEQAWLTGQTLSFTRTGD